MQRIDANCALLMWWKVSWREVQSSCKDFCRRSFEQTTCRPEHRAAGVVEPNKNNTQICSSEHFQLGHQPQDVYSFLFEFILRFQLWSKYLQTIQNPTLRMQKEWFTLLISSNMCPACGIWDLKHLFPANDSSVPLVCWKLPTTKQSWHSADRPDLWLLFCSLLLSLWLEAICRTQTASLFPHHGSALKVLIPIPHSGCISWA